MGYNRSPDGRFGPNNSGGVGNPFAKEVGNLRAKLFKKLAKGKTFDQVVDSLINQANNGNVPAIKIVFEYALGKPTDPDTALALQALQILSQPLENLIDQLMSDPEQRRILRNKLKALEIVDSSKENESNASAEEPSLPQV
jgi:hypothetical protein